MGCHYFEAPKFFFFGGFMLHEFITKEQQYILKKCDEETVKLAGSKEISPAIRKGWNSFLDQLIELLSSEHVTFDMYPDTGKPDADQKAQQASDQDSQAKTDKQKLQPDAAARGKEYRRLGYTLSDVVHGYGIVCQGITTSATELKYQIATNEFSQLNLSLDVAIAAAVTGFELDTASERKQGEIERLGFLAHELRNSLTSAFIALELIESGDVGAKSNTGKLLNRSLQSMKMLIDSALMAVRIKLEPAPHLEWVKVIDVVSDIEITSAIEARQHEISFQIQVTPDLSVFSDRQAFTSALANLTQNAVKFSHPGGKVTIRTKLTGSRAQIEIEDECGGLPEAKLKSLFKPFEQMDENKTGLGLGLTISRRAIELSDGIISARNVDSKGCVFTIDLPGRIDGESKYAPKRKK
jgi:signal transduction histidine kinase